MLAFSTKIRAFFLSCTIVLASVPTQAASTEAVVQFKIQQQSLADALLEFSYQSNIQVIMPSALAADFSVEEIIGDYTVEQALALLLKRTNLQFEFTSERTVTIRQQRPDTQPVERRRRRLEQLGLEQMFVKGEHKRESLTHIPVSKIALSGEDLESRGVKNADDLQLFVPGLTVEAPETANTEISIRGAGISNDALGTASGVAVYVDDIYLPRQSTANLSIYELDRVEILRGPQSTRYAHNATGGSIIYVTRKPSADFEARYLIEAGNYNLFNNLLTVNGEMQDGLLGQLALSSYKRDPIMQNSQPRVDGNDIDSNSGRLAFRYEKSKGFEWLMTLDIESREQSGVLYSIGPDGPFQFADGLPLVAVSEPVRTTEVDTPGQEELESLGLMTRFDIEADSYTASFIYGRRSHEFSGLYDLDQTAELLVNKSLFESSDSNSLELRWSSRPLSENSIPGAWYWNLGIMALMEKAETAKSYLAPGLAAGSNQWNQSLEQDSYSAYGDIYYQLTAKTRLAAGLRYLADFSTYHIIAIGSDARANNVYLQENFTHNARQVWRRLTPRLTIDFSLNPGTSLYLSAASGYKPGGYSGTPRNLASAKTLNQHERATSYEAGLHGNWLDDRIKMNAAVYSADYRDMQIAAFDPVGNNMVQNAARAISRGFEIELQTRPITSLKIGAGMSFIDAKFDQFVYQKNGQFIDKRGDRVPRIPDVTFNLSVAYLFPDTRLGSWSIRADAAFSEEAVDINNNPAWLDHRKYSLWFDYLPHNGKWELSLWVRNLRNKEYFQASLPGITNVDNAFARKLEPPRSSGLSLKYFW